MIDPKLDLVLERTVDVPPELVWAAWTRPEQVKVWFTPRPWKTVECEIELRPGGVFRTVMESPAGERSPTVGCYLEIVPNRRLVWTTALAPGFRPAGPAPSLPFAVTAIIALAPEGTGTKYTATVLHSDEGARDAHEQMGFQAGWSTALDQLVAQVKARG